MNTVDVNLYAVPGVRRALLIGALVLLAPCAFVSAANETVPELTRPLSKVEALNLALAKNGHPYESHMVIEDVPGKAPEEYTAALRYQQKEHMERGVEHAKKVLDLGIRWRA